MTFLALRDSSIHEIFHTSSGIPDHSANLTSPNQTICDCKDCKLDNSA